MKWCVPSPHPAWHATNFFAKEATEMVLSCIVFIYLASRPRTHTFVPFRVSKLKLSNGRSWSVFGSFVRCLVQLIYILCKSWANLSALPKTHWRGVVRDCVWSVNKYVLMWIFTASTDATWWYSFTAWSCMCVLYVCFIYITELSMQTLQAMRRVLGLGAHCVN